MFLQGIGGAARLWDPQVADFRSAGYEPIALDLPGYGARPPVDHMTFDMLAADVEAAIDARKLDRPAIHLLRYHAMGEAKLPRLGTPLSPLHLGDDKLAGDSLSRAVDVLRRAALEVTT